MSSLPIRASSNRLLGRGRGRGGSGRGRGASSRQKLRNLPRPSQRSSRPIPTLMSKSNQKKKSQNDNKHKSNPDSSETEPKDLEAMSSTAEDANAGPGASVDSIGSSHQENVPIVTSPSPSPSPSSVSTTIFTLPIPTRARTGTIPAPSRRMGLPKKRARPKPAGSVGVGTPSKRGTGPRASKEPSEKQKPRQEKGEQVSPSSSLVEISNNDVSTTSDTTTADQIANKESKLDEDEVLEVGPRSVGSSGQDKPTTLVNPMRKQAAEGITTSKNPTASSSQSKSKRQKQKRVIGKSSESEALIVTDIRKMKMKDFIRDSKQGKKMKSARIRDAKRQEIRRRRKEESRKRRLGILENEYHLPKKLSEKDIEAMAAKPLAPAVQLDQDGKIVLNEQSLLHKQVREAPATDTYAERGEDLVHITSASFKNRKSSTRWTDKETRMFYMALRQCGTDFTMMATFFATRTRDEVKKMYKREERRNPVLLNKALDSRCALSLDFKAIDAELGASANAWLLEDKQDESSSKSNSPEEERAKAVHATPESKDNDNDDDDNVSLNAKSPVNLIPPSVPVAVPTPQKSVVIPSRVGKGNVTKPRRRARPKPSASTKSIRPPRAMNRKKRGGQR